MHILMPTIYFRGYKLSFKWTYTFPSPLFYMLQETTNILNNFPYQNTKLRMFNQKDLH